MADVRGDFAGGLWLPSRTPEPPWPIIDMPPPAELWLPLRGPIGLAADPCVSPGDAVVAGQCIATAPDGLGAAVHAPLAATVLGVAPRAVPGGADAVPHLGLAVAAAQPPARHLPPLAYDTLDADAFHRRLAEAGVVGLGGAGFPAGAKAAEAPAWLILNGAECEPLVACDAALMTEYAHDVVEAARWWQRALGAGRVALAIEAHLQAARAALAAAQAGFPGLEIVVLPDRYPAGGERQVITAVTGQELPAGALPAQIGVRVQNVATVLAGLRAAREGEPLTHRIVSVAGAGIARPGNVRVAIGTPAHHVIAHLGGYTDVAAALIAGGPMMGHAAADDGFAIGKTTLALTVLGRHEWRGAGPSQPCIRCGDCAPVCPARLQPHRLHALLAAGEAGAAADDGLMDCIACGACDLVCPSRIHLASAFREAQAIEQLARFQRAQAQAAEARHVARSERLQRVAAEQAAQQAQRQQKAAAAAQAALARARARRPAADDADGAGGSP